MPEITDLMQGSPALQFVVSRGWTWKPGASSNIELETCPYCNKTGYGHFYMEVHGPGDPQQGRDGLFMCHRCGKGGNLFSLKQKLGLVGSEVSSQKTWAEGKKQDTLPDVAAAHEALLADANAMDYLINVRGFSRAIIERQKLGIVPEHYFRKAGKQKALVYPYLVNGSIVWAHYRTLPDVEQLDRIPKDFASPTGWDSRLYNEEVLKDGLKEIILVEGEANVIAALDHGITNICGIPGANNKKAEWIDIFAKIGIEKIYVLYDPDKAGRKGSQDIASRIGIEKCYKLALPKFQIPKGEGTTAGKDLNEWFMYGGGTKEALEILEAEAKLFDVDGVANVRGAVDEFMEELDAKGAGQKYNFPLWKHLIQFDEGDCVDIMAEEKVGKTTVGLLIMDHMTRTYGESGVVICLEMTRAKLARKWVCQRTGISDFLPTTPEEANALKAQFEAAKPGLIHELEQQDGDLLFSYPKYDSADDIYKHIIDCIRRYGCKWIMFDNLQRLCDTTIGKDKNRTQYLSEISKTLSQICKDYNVQMIRIVQPHAIGHGRVISVRDADGASQIAKDSDATITLYRPRVGDTLTKEEIERERIQSTESFKPEMLVTVGNSRYSSGGQDQFYFDGATGRLLPLSEGRIAAMNQARSPVGYAESAVAHNMPDTAAIANAQAGLVNGNVQV